MSKHHLKSLVFSSLLILLFCACQEDPVRPTVEPFSVNVVVNDLSGKPIEGLQIAAWCEISGFDVQKSATDQAVSDHKATDRLSMGTLDGETGDINCNGYF